ncbi:MAG TPA: 2-hydroxyacid dehydrogenase [Kineosporiaceae bacterium]|nr:2-hydroxyacid dehydrogenase [Kineosporiaceae bacterium]
MTEQRENMVDDDKVQVLVPWAQNQEHAPTKLSVAVYDGATAGGPADLDLSAVELYVMPYGRPAARDLIAQLPSLRALQVLTAGFDDVLAVLPDGVELHNGTGLHDASTAEHALALILAAQRDLPRWAADQQAQRWAPRYTRSLADSRVLIVGYGNIGRAIEQRLLPFETTVTRMARRARPEDDVHPIEDLHRLLPEADVLVLVLPQNEQTQGLLGAAELALLPDDALVVNVGRGPALNTAALLAERGRIRAALDVVDPEPLPPGHPLWAAPGVYLTPHVAGGSATFPPRARRFIDDQLRRWASGEPLINRVR